MWVVPGPASQDAVFKHIYASLGLPCWAIPLCSFCNNTNGAEILSPLEGRAWQIFKNLNIFVVGALNAPRLPIGAAIAPHFAHKRGMPVRSAVDYILCKYCQCYIACSPLPIIQELAYKMGTTDQKRQYGKYNVMGNCSIMKK
jgi:hypothetical protein